MTVIIGYVISYVVTYLFLKWVYLRTSGEEWTKSDRGIALLLSIIGPIGIILGIIALADGYDGDKKASW